MSKRSTACWLALSLTWAFTGVFTGGCRGRTTESKNDRWTVPGEPPLRELVRAGEFGDRRLTEASGVVASTTEPGVLWSQNDSGHAAMLFAYDSTGAPRGAVQVRDADNTDWEAIASGPCPRGECLYIGDVGDNVAWRSHVRVWRVPSPISTARVTESATVRRIAQRYRGRTDFHEFPHHGHWLIGEPEWEDLAEFCRTWLAVPAHGGMAHQPA